MPGKRDDTGRGANPRPVVIADWQRSGLNAQT